MDTLYKKDSKGTILQWDASVGNDMYGIHILIKYGELDGKLVENKRDNIKGKNINKSNETTPMGQATIEVDALYKKKRREGYRSLDDLGFNNEENANLPFSDNFLLKDFLTDNLKFDTRDLEDNLKPMKAQQYFRSKKDKGLETWKDPKGKIWDDRKYYYLLNPHEPKESGAIIMKFPCLIQPKINGVRATISLDETGRVQILSKDGLKYNLPLIEEEFQNNSEIFNLVYNPNEDPIILDGELYIHKESLQNIVSAVKKQNFNTPRLKFVIFDLAIPLITNINRFKLVKELLQFTKENLNTNIEIIKTFNVKDDENVQVKTDEFIKEGYEGSILRNSEGLYAFGKRPQDMCKLKRTITEEFKIIDIIPQDKNPNLGMFVCISNNGEEFKVTPKMTENEKQVLLFTKQNYLGKKLSCTFYEYTDKNIPFHVIDNIVRDYE